MSMLEGWPSIAAATMGLRLFMSMGTCTTAASLHFDGAGGAALASKGLTNIANSAACCRILARRDCMAWFIGCPFPCRSAASRRLCAAFWTAWARSVQLTKCSQAPGWKVLLKKVEGDPRSDEGKSPGSEDQQQLFERLRLINRHADLGHAVDRLHDNGCGSARATPK